MKNILMIMFLFVIQLFPQSSVDSLEIIKQRREIELLQQRNQDLLNFQENLSSTVYWSLGFSATFLILFLGINIYFLRNRYNEDKERFLKHIEDTLKLKVNELDNETKTLIEKSIKSNLDAVKSSIESVKSEITDNKIFFNDDHIELLKIKNSPKSTILYNYFRQALTCKSTKNYWYWGWKISNCMDEMKKLLEEGAKFDPDELTNVTEFLDSLPSQYADSVYTFRETLRKVSV